MNDSEVVLAVATKRFTLRVVPRLRRFHSTRLRDGRASKLRCTCLSTERAKVSADIRSQQEISRRALRRPRLGAQDLACATGGTGSVMERSAIVDNLLALLFAGPDTNRNWTHVVPQRTCGYALAPQLKADIHTALATPNGGSRLHARCSRDRSAPTRPVARRHCTLLATQAKSHLRVSVT